MMAQEYGSAILQGVKCEYEIVEQRSIAPGAKYAMYQFYDMPVSFYKKKMRVHVVSIDVTNPYNSFAPYLSKDQFFEADKQSEDVKFRKEKGLKPVASMMGSAFVQTNGTHEYNTPNEVVGGLVENSAIKYEASWNSRMFYMDDLAHIGVVKFSGSVVADGKSYPISQINHHRDHAGQNIALFCNGVPRSASSAGTLSYGTDVRVRLKGASSVSPGTTVCEVVEVLSGCGHTLGEGEAILSGVNSASDFLALLTPGSEISINVEYSDAEGRNVQMQQGVCKFFEYGIFNGEVKGTDADEYPICALGCSEDGKTVYMCDLEFSSKSNASVQCFMEFMKHLGVYNLLPLDGGPSAEMTLDGEFITESSIPGFEGRPVPNGAILYSTAPDDPNITEVECSNAKNVWMKYGMTFTPYLYAYNQYGEMILADAKSSPQIKVSCSPEVGTIADDGYTFIANGIGDGYIYVEVPNSGSKISIPVLVEDSCSISLNYESLFTCPGRGCQLELSYTKNGVTEKINPKDVDWRIYGDEVIGSCVDGYVVPVAEGKATIDAWYKDMYVTAQVEVENLPSRNLDLTDKLEFNDVEDVRLPGLPLSFVLTLKARKNGKMYLEYTAGSRKYEVESDELTADDVWECRVDLDRDSFESYPVVLNSIYGTSRPTARKLVAYYYSKIKGDLDNNGFIELNDISLLLSLYLGENSDADGDVDVDGDGVFTINDVVTLVSIYLQQ